MQVLEAALASPFCCLASDNIRHHRTGIFDTPFVTPSGPLQSASVGAPRTSTDHTYKPELPLPLRRVSHYPRSLLIQHRSLLAVNIFVLVGRV